MKIKRSVTCSLKFSTASKRERVKQVLEEYSRVVNYFIDRFWPDPPRKLALLKHVLDVPDTWLSARLRKVAAREAVDMVLAARSRYGEKAQKARPQGAKDVPLLHHCLS